MESGKFISVEGIEGGGKSTNIDVLVKCIEEAGHKVLTTREPGGTPFAEDIREILMNRSDEPVPEIAELLLMFAARSFNVNNVIVPALEAGTWVVSDRFTDSSRAYQGGGRGIPMETINSVAEWVHADTWPDLTILLDLDVEVGHARARAASGGKEDRMEAQPMDFFRLVRQGYLDLAKEEPNRIAVIDASLSIDEVTESIQKEFADRLGEVEA